MHWCKASSEAKQRACQSAPIREAVADFGDGEWRRAAAVAWSYNLHTTTCCDSSADPMCCDLTMMLNFGIAIFIVHSPAFFRVNSS